MRIKGEVSDSYFFGKICYPGSKRGVFGLEMLNLGAAWVVVKGGSDGGEDVVHVYNHLFPF